MPRYVPITNDLCLVEQDVKVKKVVTKKGPINNLWIYDRSGSMHEYLPDLTRQLISLSRELEKGNSLTLGWFSSENKQFNWVFKGFRIVDNADYKALEQAIKNNSTSLGTTCFSEILADTDTVIKDLSVISKTFSLNFFTDGYPVVSNYTKEINDINSALNKIKGRIHTAMVIGFGRYYNRELLLSISEKINAVLIHSSEIREYTPNLVKLIKMTDNSEPKEEVDCLVSDPVAMFTVNDQGVVILSVDEETGKVYIAPQKDKATKVYYVSKEKPNKKSWDKVEVSAINFGDLNDCLAKALYGAALVLSQQTKTDISMEILGKAGDKNLIEKLNNAFQIEEYGAAEELISKAVNDVSFRFKTGRDQNYLPPADAFCVFDALNILTDDDEAAFYPYHENFQYERIGVASKSKEGYPKFEPDKRSKCPFNNLTWHENRLNLSVQTKVSGTINLHDVEGVPPRHYGFTEVYPTFVFRNFSFVKDGHVNIKTFYITSSEETYKVFKNKGLVIEDSFNTNKIYGLDISKLPVINRKIAEGKTSATELAKMTLEEQRLKAQIKSLKWLKDEELGDVVSVPVTLTDEQATFLTAHGIMVDRGGLFQPPVEKEEPVDFYMAKTFEIKLTGIATLPSVKKIMEKIAANKARTPVEALVEEGIKKWNSVRASLTTRDSRMKWFDDTIKNLQNRLKEIRQVRQKISFSVLLAHKWFEEWQSRENCELLVENVRCVFELGEEKVAI